MRRLGRGVVLTTSQLPAVRLVAAEGDAETHDVPSHLLVCVWLDDGMVVDRALLHAGYAQLLNIAPKGPRTDYFCGCAEGVRVRRDLWVWEPEAPR